VARSSAEQRGGGGEQKPAARSAPWSRAAAAGRARHSHYKKPFIS